MPRKVVPPKVSAVMAASDPLLKVKRAKLRQALGLEPAEGEDSILATFPRPRTFTREEVIALLGDLDRGISRMLPVDVALGRLGMPIIKANPDGTAERLIREFPKAWLARDKSDRAIATHVAKTYTEVPEGWYPDGGRLQISDAAAAAAGLPALGPAERAALAELAPFFRFDLVPGDLRLAGYQVWQRRRLAGVGPSSCEGLLYGFWDDVMSAYDIGAMCWRGLDAATLAATLAAARDLCLAEVASRASGSAHWAIGSGLYGAVNMAFVMTVSMEDSAEADPELRTLGRGFAQLYRRLEAKPGAVWSARPVRERPEATLGGISGFCLLGSRERFDLGELRLEPELDWVSKFASA